MIGTHMLHLAYLTAKVSKGDVRSHGEGLAEAATGNLDRECVICHIRSANKQVTALPPRRSGSSDKSQVVSSFLNR